jgi:hypothetical protein
MLLGGPWLRDAKVAHDWGSNIITIQKNGVVKIIIVTKHLGGEVKKPKVLLCYDYHNGITYEEEYIIFVIELKLFSIGTINLQDNSICENHRCGDRDTNVNISIVKQEFGVQYIEKKIVGTKYELEVALE